MKVRIICDLSSSPLGTALNLLPTISFSADELDDELDEDEDEESDLFLFSCVDFDFFHFFLLERFTISGLDEGQFIFIFLDLGCLSCFLVAEVSRFSDTFFAGSSYELSPAFSFFLPCLITGVNCRESNIFIMLICMSRLSIFQTF